MAREYERTFDAEVQSRFSDLSGDHNPVHVDAVAARRSLFGQQVVHGVHLLLWSLGALGIAADARRRLARVSAAFKQPVPVGATARAEVSWRSESEFALRIECAGETAATLRGTLADGTARGDVASGRPPKRAPRELAPAEIAAARGEAALCLDAALAHELCAGAFAVLAPLQIAALLASTRVIGMECPGLYSLYGALDVSFDAEGAGPSLAYAVTSFDARFLRLEMQFTGAATRIRATAFVRPPVAQRGAAELRAAVRRDEFADTRALVVGGSRGLGEVIAKLLGGGGADVVVTYAQGRAEAERVAADIASAGGRARALRLDVLDAAAVRAVLADGAVPTLLAYFASPFIGSGSRAFSPAQFQRFCGYYVDGFAHVAEALLARAPERLSILYPSSEFVTARPANMAEYAAAKSAGEVVCAQLAQRRGVRVHCPRIGKLSTDQTQSLLSVDSGDPVPPMLAALRQLSEG